MDLCNINTIKKILSENNFSISKKLSQNFIIDPFLCPEIVSRLSLDKDTGIIEIGPGLGTLTQELIKSGAKVLSIEADKRLPDILETTLGSNDNLKIITADFLKLDLHKIITENFPNSKYLKICSNLPYSVTTTIITHILKSGIKFDDIVFMMQKETAERITADIPSRNSSAVTVMVNYYAESEFLFSVSSESFYPKPNVDSAVVRLTPRTSPVVKLKSEEMFFKIVNSVFTQRRKTLANSLSNALKIPKDTVNQILSSMNIKETTRPEELSIDDFAALSDKFYYMPDF